MGIFYGILSFLHNNVIDVNNVLSCELHKLIKLIDMYFVHLLIITTLIIPFSEGWYEPKGDAHIGD